MGQRIETLLGLLLLYIVEPANVINIIKINIHMDYTICMEPEDSTF